MNEWMNEFGKTLFNENMHFLKNEQKFYASFFLMRMINPNTFQQFLGGRLLFLQWLECFSLWKTFNIAYDGLSTQQLVNKFYNSYWCHTKTFFNTTALVWVPKYLVQTF